MNTYKITMYADSVYGSLEETFECEKDSEAIQACVKFVSGIQFLKYVLFARNYVNTLYIKRINLSIRNDTMCSNNGIFETILCDKSIQQLVKED